MKGQLIEDTISRNKQFQKERLQRLERLKELRAPAIIIENEELISKMTLPEYRIYCQSREEEGKKLKLEYAKNNPIQKSIVDEIYNRESKLTYDYFVCSSRTRMMMKLDPLSFMSQDDFDNDLYETFLNHAIELYYERFKEQYDIDYNIDHGDE